ncbi:sorting nexin-24-like isoform X2 [Vespa velutina]|uniref:sorting nexin-24-like isoform X2 n=1 Tax=Vespa velutina TaxID=202808 RepID=UPI001FB3C05E|nr:sorting nexin-24-like isoform X2 [Vespa velutina]
MSVIKKIISDAMYQAFINGYRLVEVSHGRPYYVYCVELFETDSGIRYFSERRYSEFSALHRTLKKNSTNIAPFPPKRVRNSQPKVLEQRREALEVYIQKMLKLPVAKQQVLNFLGIEGRSSGVTEKRGQKQINDLGHIHPSSLGHHPVLTFHRDPYIHVNKNTSLPDIVTNGVLLGLYKS